MEDLNKNQLVLLALLVSFVTSIATGIATVSLFEQAPSDVTRVINRVVERTVETVVPTQGASVITKETTVIVKEEDAITKAIASLSKSLVGVSVDTPEGEAFLGLGFAILDGTKLITDSALVSDAVVYKIKTTGGATTTAKTILQDEEKGLAVLEISKDKDIKLSPVSLADGSSAKLGQSVMTLSGLKINTVSTGIVSNITRTEIKVPVVPTGEDKGGEPKTETKSIVSALKTNISTASYLPGTPLINLFGEVVGVSVGDGSSFLGSDVLKEFLKTQSVGEGNKEGEAA